MRISYVFFFIIILPLYSNAKNTLNLYIHLPAPSDTNKIFSNITDTTALNNILNDSILLASIVGAEDVLAKKMNLPSKKSLFILRGDFLHKFIVHQNNAAYKIIFQLRSLTRLDLDNLNLDSIPLGLDNLKNLVILDLVKNNLTHIPAVISKLKKLRVLYLDANDIKYIPDDFIWPDSLEMLEISENDLQKIPLSLKKLTKLNDIGLRQNSKLADNNWLKTLSAIHSLKGIDINYTSIDTLGAEIGNMKQLKYLYLGGTKIKYLPKGLIQLENLEILDLSGLDSLDNSSFDNICGLNHLNSLYLNNCNLDTLPDCFKNLDSLKVLYLFGNSFHTVPRCICSMNQLVQLFLTSNYIASLPDCLGGLSNLKFLGLGDNKINKSEVELLQKKLPTCSIGFDQNK